MADLREAISVIRAIRYGGDEVYEQSTINGETRAWALFRHSGVEVSPDVLPQLSASVERACERVTVPRASVRVFVFPGADIQAQCVTVTRSICALRISSALVERFSVQEMEFVVGHEIGHFLLGFLPVEGDSWTVESAQRSRKRELSCDRVGLIACGDVHWALRAIMKLASGLDERFLRFDAGAYLNSALANYSDTADPTRAYSSHPPMPIRARALLWFDEFRRGHFPCVEGRALAKLKKIDARVNKDMVNFVEREAKQILADAELELARWVWVGAAISGGRLDQDGQRLLAERFSVEFCEKVRNRAHGCTNDEVFEWVSYNAVQAFNRLRQAFPSLTLAVLQTEIQESEQTFLDGRRGNFLRKTHWQFMD